MNEELLEKVSKIDDKLIFLKEEEIGSLVSEITFELRNYIHGVLTGLQSSETVPPVEGSALLLCEGFCRTFQIGIEQFHGYEWLREIILLGLAHLVVGKQDEFQTIVWNDPRFLELESLLAEEGIPKFFLLVLFLCFPKTPSTMKRIKLVWGAFDCETDSGHFEPLARVFSRYIEDLDTLGKISVPQNAQRAIQLSSISAFVRVEKVKTELESPIHFIMIPVFFYLAAPVLAQEQVHKKWGWKTEFADSVME